LKKFGLANRKIRVTIFPKKTGRPAKKQSIVDKIIELKLLNSSWGGQKIADELFKIGIKITKHKVLKYLEVYGLRTPPPFKTISWSEFLLITINSKLVLTSLALLMFLEGSCFA